MPPQLSDVPVWRRGLPFLGTIPLPQKSDRFVQLVQAPEESLSILLQACDRWIQGLIHEIRKDDDDLARQAAGIQKVVPVLPGEKVYPIARNTTAVC